jgi:hypothetical protein
VSAMASIQRVKAAWRRGFGQGIGACGAAGDWVMAGGRRGGALVG